jgi:hypothetical protein
MSFVRVRDHALRASDIYGNAALADRIVALEPGECIELVVNGFRGQWTKLPAGAGGHRVRAAGEAQRLWLAQRDTRWAGIVPIRAVDE